jgi:hypothetical protein
MKGEPPDQSRFYFTPLLRAFSGEPRHCHTVAKCARGIRADGRPRLTGSQINANTQFDYLCVREGEKVSRVFSVSGE